MKLIYKIFSIIGFTIFVIPLGILICIIVGPFYIIISLYKDMFKELELKDEIKINDGEIFLVYTDQIKFDFKNYFKKHEKSIRCIKINDDTSEKAFNNYLIKNYTQKQFPILVKIEGKNLIHKELYSPFRQLIKRNDNPYSFCKLLEQSIRKLNKESYQSV